MQRINTNRPLKVERIYLKGHVQPIENCEVFIMDRFLIVSKDENTAPTWYNLDCIEKLVGVELSEQEQQNKGRAMWL